MTGPYWTYEDRQEDPTDILNLIPAVKGLDSVLIEFTPEVPEADLRSVSKATDTFKHVHLAKEKWWC